MSLYPLISAMQLGKCPNEQRMFYDMFSKKMFMLCKRYLSIDTVSEEVLMEGFIRFFDAMPTFEYVNDKMVVAFLRKSMIIECLRYMDRTKKNYPVIITELEKANEVTIDEIATSGITKKELHELISGLPEDLRIIFCMRAFDGYTHVEIGKHLNLSYENAALKYHRAKKILQEKVLKSFSHGER